MSNETPVTVQGNVVADPEMRFLASGAAVVNFTIASTPRHFDKNTNEWVDGEPLFMRCAAYRRLAENVAESLSKGHRVIATGHLRQRSYETREGQKRTVVEMEVTDVGHSLMFVTSQIKRADGAQQAKPKPAPADPWADSGVTDEVPF